MHLPPPSFRFASLRIVATVLLVAALNACWGDGPADNRPDNVRPIPPLGIEIPSATIESLQQRCADIESQWQALVQTAAEPGRQADGDHRLQYLRSLAPEILVFPRAVRMAIEFQQFYRPSDPKQADELLDEAARRIKVARDGGSWRDVVALADGSDQQLIVGGFRSHIDRSYQPYCLVVPPGFGKSDVRPRRLDLWFHGRGEKLSEVAFLTGGRSSAGRYTPADTFVLHPYGRYSNAFKFAGEVDVLEALQYLQSRLPVDPNRVSVRGFSMGGAGCWQFATHYADRWFAANPGAGFCETPEFLKFFQQEDVRQSAPPYQQTLWQLYDCPLWSVNLRQCPTVAYSGEVDRQKQAADVMASALQELGIDLVHIIGPGTAHNIHPDSKVQVEARLADLARTASGNVPNQIDYTTVTLRYHRMHWLDLRGLNQHWSPARVTASIAGPARIEISTENVSDLRLAFSSGQWPGVERGPVQVEIDGRSITGPIVRSDRSWSIDLTRDRGDWRSEKRAGTLRKRPGLQGPIDDAFMDPFLFVLPSRVSRDAELQQWIENESEHAMLHWRKHFRGDVRSVLDRDLTIEQMAENHLVLFGDLTSNSVLQRIADELPLQWTADSISIGKASVPGSGHVPVLVYPNPLDPQHYVVINSGFTFREYDYLNNARQTPKLPDWALIDIRGGATSQSPGKVKRAGFFDEHWQP